MPASSAKDVPLGPTQVHPQQHGGEVGGIHSPGLGADRDQGIALVILAGQKGPDLQSLDIGRQCLQLLLGFGERARVVLLDSEFDQHAEVVHASAKRHDPVDLSLQPRQSGRDQLCVLLVVPEIGRRCLFGELGDFGTFGSRVDDALDGGQGPVQHGQVGLQVSSSHSGSLYLAHSRTPLSGERGGPP